MRGFVCVLALVASASAQAASGGMGVAIRVTIKARSVIPYIIDTTPDDGASVTTAAPALQVFFDQDMDTSRRDTARVLLPAGMTITGLSWADARTLNISYTGSLSSYGAKRVDLADGYFVSTVGQPIPVGGGFAFYYANPNNPPVIVRGPTPTPITALPNQPVTFDVIAYDANGDALTYTWDFGDQTSGAGASVTHMYATMGPFLAVVSVSDGRGGSTSGAVLVGAAAAASWTVTKAQVGLNFKVAGKDKIQITGLVDQAAGFDPNGKTVTVDAGGVSQTFKLNSKGMAKTAKDRFKLTRKLKKRQFLGGAVKVQFRLSGAFVAALVDEGMTNVTTPKTGTRVAMKIVLSIDGRAYEAFPTLMWKAKADKSGKGTQTSAIK